MPRPLPAVLVALLLALPAHGTVPPAVRCQTAKLQAASARARALLVCQASAISAAVAVDPACVARAAERFRTTFANAEGRGGCPTAGDGAAVAGRVDAFVARAVTIAAAAPTGCGPPMLGAGGRYLAARFGAEKGYKRSSGNAARLVGGQAHAASALAAYLARAGCTSPAAGVLTAAAGDLLQAVVPPLVCGDGIRDPGEVCDGGDARACPGRCEATCRCATPAPFACLATDAATTTISGTHGEAYEDAALVSGAGLDARAATFLAAPANLYPINLRGGGGVCLAGGTVAGQYDRTLSWEAMHDLNNAGLRFENDAFTVDGLRVDDVGDGIRPVGRDFTVRAAWLSWVRDDCVEDDHLHGGLIEDSLFDGCYVGVSERPSPAILDGGADGRQAVLTIHATLVRLQPMPGPDGGSTSGHGQFFKWHERASALALHDNVFLAEQVGQGGADTMGIPEGLVSCAGNVVVWLGEGDYPAPLPSCFTVTRNRAVWDAAVADWHHRHPEVGGS